MRATCFRSSGRSRRWRRSTRRGSRGRCGRGAREERRTDRGRERGGGVAGGAAQLAERGGAVEPGDTHAGGKGELVGRAGVVRGCRRCGDLPSSRNETSSNRTSRVT